MGTPKANKLRIICINDVYTFSKEEVGMGGFAAASSMVKRMRKECEGNGIDTVFLLAGDFLGGSSLVEYFKGEVAIDVLNVMDIDALVIGNHEFDFGWTRLEELVKKSTTPLWLGANVFKTETNTLIDGVQSHKIITTKSGIKVGIFGVCTQATPSMSHPGEGIEFRSVNEATRGCIASLKTGGADIIIALTHLSAVEDKALIRQFPDIDFVVGGHDHDPLAQIIQDKLLFKCGQNAYWVGTIDIVLNSGKKVLPSWCMLETQDEVDDPQVMGIVERYRALKEKEIEASIEGLDDVVCTITADLDTRTTVVRRRESSAGNLIADALMFYFTSYGANPDMAIINGGFIRGDKLYPAGSKITKREVLDELPFPRTAVCTEILGKYLLEAVEQELRLLPEPGGLFPHYSSAVVLRFDSHQPPLRRVISMTINGEPVQAEKKYRVCLTEFMAAGGDGCSSFSYGQIISHELGVPEARISAVLLKYCESHPTVTPGIFKRCFDVIDESK